MRQSQQQAEHQAFHDALTYGHLAQLGVSLGCAVFPDDGDAPEALLAIADRAMYRAKRGLPECAAA